MAKKTKLTKQRLIELFMDNVLEHNETPKSVYAFAKMNHFEESEFYSFFGSFQALESSIFETFFDNAVAEGHPFLNKNEKCRKEKTPRNPCSYWAPRGLPASFTRLSDSRQKSKNKMLLRCVSE